MTEPTAADYARFIEELEAERSGGAQLAHAMSEAAGKAKALRGELTARIREDNSTRTEQPAPPDPAVGAFVAPIHAALTRSVRRLGLDDLFTPPGDDAA